MVAIFTGLGAGFERGSGSTLGATGLLGGAAMGRGGEQLFLNAANGNLLINNRDEFLIGRGPDAAIARTYNSQGSLHDENGDGWRQSTNRAITLYGTMAASGSRLSRVSGDGSEIFYDWNGSHYATTEGGGAHDKITYAAGELGWIDGDRQMVETYRLITGGGQLYRMVRQSDSDGNSLTFTYGADGKLNRVTAADGAADRNYIEYRWSGNNITQVDTAWIDHTVGQIKTLTRTRYGYDAQNRLTSVTVDLSPENKDITDGRTYVTTYTYDGSSTRVQSITQSDGSKVEFGYEGFVSGASVQGEPDTIDGSGASQPEISDGEGDVVVGAPPPPQSNSVTYKVTSIRQWVDAVTSRLTTIDYDTGNRTTTITDPSGAQTRMTYDFSGQLTQIQQPALTAGAGQPVTSFEYNPTGDVIRVSRYRDLAQLAANNPAAETRYDYDSNGNARQITDGLGNVVTRTYGNRNELLVETSTIATGVVATSRYVYDAENHLRYAISPEGRVTEYRYFADGSLESTIEYPEHTYTYTPPAGGVPPPPSPLPNSSFEAPEVGSNFVYRPTVSGMTFASSAGIAGNGSALFFPSAPDGDQVAFIQDRGSTPGSISQSVSGLTAGATYTVKFRLDRAFEYQPAPITVSFDGQALGTFIPASWGAFQEFTVSFVANSPTGTLTFAGPPTGVEQMVGDRFTAIDNVRISGPAGPPPGPSEAELNAWRDAISDRSSSRIVVNAYDARGSLVSSISYGAATAAGAASTAEGFARVTYAYDQAGQLLSRIVDGQIAETFTYDGLGRVVSSTDLNGARSNIVFNDAASRTVVSLANGYVKTSTYNRLGELINVIDSGHIAASNTALMTVASTSFETPEAGNSYIQNAPADGMSFFGSSGIAGNGSGWNFAPAPDGDQVAYVQATPGLASVFEYRLSGLAVGAQYTVKFYIGASASHGGAGVSLSFNGQFLTSFTPSSTSFQEVTATFTATQSSGQLWFSGHGTAGSATAIDKVAVQLLSDGGEFYKYDSRGLMRVATDGTGFRSYFIHDRIGRKVADVNHLGEVVEYVYDALGRVVGTARYANRLTAVQLAVLADPQSAIDMASFRPAADPADLWGWQVYDREGRLLEAIGGDGSVVSYEYDRSGRLIKTIAFAAQLGAATLNDFKTAPPAAPLLPAGDPTRDSIARNFYDKDGHLIGRLDGEGFLSAITYDKAGLKVEEISFLQPSAVAHRAAGTFEQLLSSQPADSGDRRVRYVYDGQGLLRYQINGLNELIGFNYNGANQLTSTVRYPLSISESANFKYKDIKPTADSYGSLAATRRDWVIYDSAGRAAYTIDAAGGVVRLIYDNVGQVARSVQYEAARATATLPTLADMEAWASTQASNAKNRTTRNFYDSSGDLRFTVDPEGFVSGTEYDAEGRIVRLVRWKDRVALTDADTIQVVEDRVRNAAFIDGRNVYDPAGRLSETVDGEGVKRRLDYNATGTLKWETAAFGTTDASRTAFVYDNAGRVREQYAAHGADDEAVTRFEYDGLGNVIRTTDPNGNVSTMDYDQLGLLISHTDAENHTTTFEYNAFGEQTKVIDARGHSAVYSYDKLGRVVTVTDAEGYVTELKYTAFGELESVIRRETRAAGSGQPPAAAAAAAASSGQVRVGVGANILANASFDQSGTFTTTPVGRSNTTLPGWTKSNAQSFEQVSAGKFGITGTDGAYWLDLESVVRTGRSPVGSNLVANGSFELSGSFTPTSTGRENTTLPGWAKTNPEAFEQVLSGQLGVAASDGSYWLDLDSVARTGIEIYGSNLVTNGSFEMSGAWVATDTGRSNTTLPGWTKTNPETFEQVQSTQLGVKASDGLYWLDLESVAQTGRMAVGSNLLVNGSFGQAGTYIDTATGRSHTTIPGWTKANPETFETVLSGQMGVTTLDGGYWLDLESVPYTGNPLPVGSNLIVNGGFELSTSYQTTATGRTATAIPGWSKTNPEPFDQVLAETTNIEPGDGVYWLDLDSVPGGGMSAGPNLIVNGSFEQSAATWAPNIDGRINSGNIPGWVKANTGDFEQINSGTMGVAATHGSFYLDMEGGGSASRMDISQTISGLAAGKSLTLKFDFANVAGMVDVGGETESSGVIQVYWNGALIGTVGELRSTMATRTFTVGTIAGDNTLRFKEIGVADGRGVFLDNVQLYENVQPSPLPSGDIAANSTTANVQTRTAVAALKFGGYIQVWETEGNVDGSGSAIIGRLFDNSGTAISAEFRVNGSGILNGVGTFSSQRFASVTGLADGGFVVVWSSYHDSPNSYGIYGQRYSANGTLLNLGGSVAAAGANSMFKVNTFEPGDQGAASIKARTDGGFVVTWTSSTDLVSNPFNNNVISRTYVGASATAGSEQTINTTTASHQLVSDVAVLGDNTGVIVWQSLNTGTNTWDLFARRLDANGVPLAGSEITITTAANNQFGVSIDTVDRDNNGVLDGYIVVWTSEGQDSATSYGIYGQLYDSNFAVVGSVFQVNDPASGTDPAANDQYHPSVLYLSNGTFGVTWDSSATFAVMGRQFSMTGGGTPVAMGGAVRISSGTGGNGFTPYNGLDGQAYGFRAEYAGRNTIDQLANGNVVVGFCNNTNAGDIFAHLVNVGVVLTPPTPPPAPNGGNMDIYQTVSGLTAGQVMQLQFDYSSRTTSASGSFEVWWNGTLVATITDGGGRMKEKTLFVTAAAGNNTLRFKGIGTVDALGAALDNVRLFATQTPPNGGNMDISQTVTGLAAGQIMQLQFDHANRTTSASGSFEVWWNNSLVETITSVGTAMQTKTYSLVAVAGNNTIRFKSLGTVDAAGASLDNVRLFNTQPVPTGGNMKISQVIPNLAAGQILQLQFDHANRTTSASGSFEVLWNGAVVATINSTGVTMQTKTYVVTAIAGNNVLEFRGLGDIDAAGASIDNVRLFLARPEPTGGNMAISQIVPNLAAGQMLQLQFDHANRTSSASGAFQVLWNGAVIATIDSTGTAMQTKTYLVTAIAGDNRLEFRAIGTIDADGASIDNVRLFATQADLSGGNMVVGQDVANLNEGQVLELKFNHANRTTSASGSFQVVWNGNVVDTIDSSDPVMQTKAYFVTAVGGTNRLEFRGLGTVDGEGASLDNVWLRVTELKSPPPVEMGSEDNGDQVTRFYYDRLGRATLTQDAEDYLTETVYDSFGDVTRITRRANRADTPDKSVPTAAPSDKDAVTQFEYDQLGRLKKVTDAENMSEIYELDAFGRRTAVVNRLGGRTTYEYDNRGLLRSETLPITSTKSNGLAAAVVNTFEYDKRGNRTKTIEAAGLPEERTTTLHYDKLDRLTKSEGMAVTVLDQNGHVAESLVTPTQTVQYDDAGNVIATVDALGARSLFYYDRANRKKAELNAIGLLTTFDYDENGNVRSTRSYVTPVSQPLTAGGPAPAAPAGEFRETIYEYDKLNRLTKTRIPNVRTGAWNGTSYALSTADIVSTLDYDAHGNIIRTTDAGGGVVYTYYDRLGRSTARVDQENYLTTWERDSEGNVLTERRASQRAIWTATTENAPVVAAHADDRVTTFDYDRNGRRRFESRANVLSYSVDANGVLVENPSKVATIEYRYNGLGLVTHKIEATGDTIVYGYDQAGRVITETHQGYTDQSDTLVKPRVTYSYNGLNLLTRTRQGGETETTGDRITSNEYVVGRLASTTDATGARYSYAYDAAGNLLRESYMRQKVGGDPVEEAILYARDILGRLTSRTVAAKSGAAWAEGDNQDISYNLFGEVSQRGTNDKWQEQYRYDKAGRLISSNAGDGVWRFFLHDRNGNQTLAIESEGMDLAGKSLDEVLAIATSGGSPNIGGAYVADINLSFNVYDGRNSAVETRLPHRELDSTGARVELLLSRDFNAFGEVAAERDAKGALTNYFYNTMGRTVSIARPIVASTNEAGANIDAQPVETLYFDLAGRLVGSRDPNGHAMTRHLLAGTGYSGSEALTLTEFHADGGKIQNRYDVYGDLRVTINEVNRATAMTYDGRGRLIRLDKASGLAEHFEYDLVGQRIKHWNSLLLETNAEITEYDMQGRIVSQRAFGGDVTTTSYQWSADMQTEGMDSFGGWIETTTYSNGRQKIEHSDVFGRGVQKTDLGGHVFNMKYDKAGRLVEQRGAETITYAYLNSGMVGTVTTSRRAANGFMEPWEATYGYDRNGNKVLEQLKRNGTLLQNATAEYDALNRLTLWTEAGTATVPYSRVAYKYDANSNIRMIHADYVGLDGFGNMTGTSSKEHWYRFDAMNRVVVSKGVFGNNGIVAGPEGVEIGYDQAGQRVRTLRSEQRMGQVYAPPPWNVHFMMPYTHEIVETYKYDAAGHLDQVFGSESTVSWNNGFIVNRPAEPGTLKADYEYDALGRLKSQKDYRDGWDVVYERTVTDYNARGQIFKEFTVSKQQVPNQQTGAREWTTFRTETKYYYGGETQTDEERLNEREIGPNALGGVVKVVNKNLRNGVLTHWSVSDTAYDWWDGAVQSVVALRADLWDPTKDSHTLFAYNAWGQLEKANVNDGRRREVRFTNNLAGEAIRRDEQDFNAAGDPHEVWHRFNGRQTGYVGNNGSLNIDYQASINARTHYVGPSQGAFRLGDGNPTAHADFDQNYSAINSFEQGSTGGSYTVRTGDTLSSIAAQLWGDSSLWYKIAEANGLGAEGGLSDGQTLTIPVGVFKNHHNASTFMPFDPGSVLGDLSPTAPRPQAPVQKKNKCGVFGQILLIVVAVAVTFLTQGALAGPMTGLFNSALAGNIVAGGIAGAAGSIASQTVGVLTGIQERFDWKGVAMAGISGAVGGALGGWNAFGKTGLGKFTDLANNITRAAAASTITQGIGVAAGLQSKFSWAAVAAAGVGAGVGALAGAKLGVKPFVDADGVRLDGSFGNFARAGMAMSAGAVASAATKSLIDGSDFGDNLVGGLAGVIGSTIGNLISYRMADKPPVVNSKPGSGTSAPSGDSNETSSPPDDQGEGGSVFIKAGFRQQQEKKKNIIGGVDVGEPTPNGRPPWKWLDPDAPEHLKEAFYNEWRDMRTVLQTPVSFEDVVRYIWGQLFPDKNILDYWRDPDEDPEEVPSEVEPTESSGFTWPTLNAGSNYYEPPPQSFGEELFNAGQDLVTAALLQDVYFDVFPDHGSVMARRTDTRAAMVGRVLGSFSPHADFINIPRSIYGVRNGEDGARFGLAVNVAGIGPSPFDVVKAATKVGKPARAAEKALERGLGAGARSNIVGRSAIPTIGGRLPINSRYAGKVHPSGVRFTKQGFPDFKPYAKAQVKVKNLTGVYGTDAALANAAVGLKSTPVGFVWHHVEDGLTMQLIPQSIHQAVRHSGGASVIKNGGFDR